MNTEIAKSLIETIVCSFVVVVVPPPPPPPRHRPSFSQFNDSATQIDTFLFGFKLVCYTRQLWLVTRSWAFSRIIGTKSTLRIIILISEKEGGRQAKIEFVLSVMYVQRSRE